MGTDIKNDASVLDFNEMTVDEWFDFWIRNIIPDLRSNTLRNYRNCYYMNIQPVIGRLKIKNVRPMHCRKVLLDMEEEYAGSTIRQVFPKNGVKMA